MTQHSRTWFQVILDDDCDTSESEFEPTLFKRSAQDKPQHSVHFNFLDTKIEMANWWKRRKVMQAQKIMHNLFTFRLKGHCGQI